MRIERFIVPFVIALVTSACGDGGGAGGTGGTGGSTGGSGATGATGGSGGTGGSGATGGSGGTGGSGATGATGGSGGTGGSGATGGSGGSGGSGGGAPCTWSAGTNPCDAGEYCKAQGCGMGTCEPVGAVEDDARNPVCGCDGVTYWNATIAASHGMAVSSAGECGPAATKQCGGFGGLTCPTDTFCNYEVQTAQQCNIADLGGTCWGVPEQCGGGVGFGPVTRQCGAAVCTEECELIKKETSWYPDNTCPQ